MLINSEPIYSLKKSNRNILGQSYYDIYLEDNKIFCNLEKVMATTLCAALNNAFRLGILKGMSH